MQVGMSDEVPMQRGDLLLCRHLATVGLPVTVAASGDVPAWMRRLPHVRGVVPLADLAACASAPRGVVVVPDATDPHAESLAVLRGAGQQVVQRYGAGWRIQARLPAADSGRVRDWLVRTLPRFAGQLGVLPLRPPFRPDGGHSWWTSLRGLRMPAQGSPRRAMLFENGRPLPFPDCVHDDIRRLGGGRYSVWNDGIYFSAADGSDPATNGRRYEVRVVAPGSDGELGPRATDEETFARRFAQLAATRSPAVPVGKRVLILISSLGPGGAERQFAYLAKGLAANGYEVGILSLDGFADAAGHYVPMLADCGVQLIDGLHAHADFAPDLLAGRVPAGAVDLLCDLPDMFAADVWRIASHVAVFAPDVLHCALDKPNLLGAMAGTCLGVPRIVLSMRNVNPSHLPYLHAPWYRRWYKLASQVPGLVLSANSHAGGADYAQWLDLPAQQIRVVHNGLDPATIRVAAEAELVALRAELQIADGAPVLVGVFRLSAEKRPFLWLEVVAALRREFPRLVALHVGLGALTDEVEARVAELGLEPCVRLLGRRKDTEVVLRAADLLLLCSEFEGIPNVILEAQWLERAVVCTVAGGNAEVVQDGVTGAVVATPDAASLAGACARMLGDGALRLAMGRAGREHVRTQFAVERMVQGSIGLYTA
ncbi:MAG TPA: glycosyltransferase [Planctomycetota bacterium]|nr:glycosyltransferase [Planctomycetota bacterium]